MKKLPLTITLAFLLTAPVLAADYPKVTAQVLAKSGASWNNSTLPAYPTGTPEISILKITIPPGVQLPMHKHPVINAGYMLKGELTVVTEKDEVLHLKAGDPIIEVVEQWHYGKNEGTEPAEIVVFYVGTANVPLSISK